MRVQVAEQPRSEKRTRSSFGLPLVAIVGRPNVGKSTLFNRLAGERRAIVGDESGMTRDRIYAQADWAGTRFSIVDTGGIVPDDDAELPANILRQAGLAIEEAEAVIWVVDARQGITAHDQELARLLRATGKRVLVAANKTDAAHLETLAAEFYRFGFPEVFPVSAEQGSGVGELLDALLPGLKRAPGTIPDNETEPELRLAIVGRPNVGKSALLNRLLGEERVIVSSEAGTTRDPVDTILKTPDQTFRLIDTAGIRRKGKTRELADKLSVIMARKSLGRADVAIILLDAKQGVAALDSTIAGYARDAGCSIIIAINKWDLLEQKDTQTAAEFERQARQRMKYLYWAPVTTVSALTGKRVEKLLQFAKRANHARSRRIQTAELNAFFARAVGPPEGSRNRLRVQYITQVGVRPPTFVVFTAGGRPGLHFSYQRQLQNRLREEFDFFATPIRIVERYKARS